MILEAEIWKVVWDELAFHTKGGDSSANTLIRLIRKHVDRRFVKSVCEALEGEQIQPSLEHWTTARLNKLWRGHNRTHVNGRFDLPIVVLRVGGVNCLIDGATRINKRVAEHMDGTHQVIILSVETDRDRE